MVTNTPIKNGYKQSEVGVIPNDWDSVKIPDTTIAANNSIKIGPFGSALKKEYLTKKGFKIYGQENVYSKDMSVGDRFLNQDRFRDLRSCEILPGDFLISMMGTVGQCLIVPAGIEAGIMDSHLLRIRFDSKKVNSRFVSQLFETRIVFNQIKQLSVGGIMEGLSSKIIKSIYIPVPSRIHEQEMLAVALADTDALIEKLENLIAKKRDIKTATMQQLLTGKKRLPGFSGKWEKKILGDLCDLKNGYSFKSSTYIDGGDYKIITIANVQDGYMDSTKTNNIACLPKDIQEHHKLKEGDILISMTGNVGRVCLVDSINSLLNQRVGKLVTAGIDKMFFFYICNSRKFTESMILKAVGGAQGNIGKGDILSYEADVPTQPEEQVAISSALYDMDVEITKLEARLNKTRELKQGMMQQLLTGNIRLV